MDFRTGKNMGYAFINFTYPYYAQMFSFMFHGTRLGFTSSTKVIHVSISRRQGLIENLELFRGSDLLSSFSQPYFKPFVLVPTVVAAGGCSVLVPLDQEIFDGIMTTSTDDMMFNL